MSRLQAALNAPFAARFRRQGFCAEWIEGCRAATMNFSGTIHYDVTRDGLRFLMIQSPTAATAEESASALTVVSNWQAGLRPRPCF
jgi:hypothetical protein